MPYTCTYTLTCLRTVKLVSCVSVGYTRACTTRRGTGAVPKCAENNVIGRFCLRRRPWYAPLWNLGIPSGVSIHQSTRSCTHYTTCVLPCQHTRSRFVRLRHASTDENLFRRIRVRTNKRPFSKRERLLHTGSHGYVTTRAPSSDDSSNEFDFLVRTASRFRRNTFTEIFVTLSSIFSSMCSSHSRNTRKTVPFDPSNSRNNISNPLFAVSSGKQLVDMRGFSTV